MIELLITLATHLLVLLAGYALGKTRERRRRKASPVSPFLRAPFDEELKEHLARIDARVISNDQFRYMQSGIYETPYAPPGQLIFVNPATLADIIAKSDPTQFRIKITEHTWPIDRATLERFDLLFPPHERPIQDTTEGGT